MIQAARAPVQLLWLDLSFNQLTDIDEALLDLPNLRVLYLHANEIREGAPIRRLGKLKQLTNLTIHGNPLDCQPNINKELLCLIPSLTKLNFSPVTRLQRDDAQQWQAARRRGGRRKK